MSNKKTKVLIVDDSPTALELLKYIISKDPELEVIGTAKSGEECLQFLKQNSPEVITLDVVMPGIQGYELTKKILETRKVPIVIITAAYNPKQVDSCFQAMEAGAFSIIQKPSGFKDEFFHEQCKSITETIKTVREIDRSDVNHSTYKFQKSINVKGEIPQYEAVAIGGSLGAPQVLHTILNRLPEDFPVPIYVVQHIMPGYVQGMVSWLNYSSALTVVLAEDGQQGKPGHVYIAPDKSHMEVLKGNVIHLDCKLSKSGFQPSLSRLFRSMVTGFGPRAIGVILTGLGRDGVEELKLMKLKGALTISQDMENSALYGMAQEAVRTGAVRQSLSPERIAQQLKHIFLRKANV